METSFWTDLNGLLSVLGSIALIGTLGLGVYHVREDPRFRAVPWWGWLVWACGSALLALGNTGNVRTIFAVVAAISLGALMLRLLISASENWRLKGTATFMNEDGNTWALMLTRKGGGASGVECIVTDPLGAKARESFGQADQVVHVSYPDAFECVCYATSKKPWGRYKVEWNVLRLTKGLGKMRREGRAKVFFNWQPFLKTGTEFGRGRFRL